MPGATDRSRNKVMLPFTLLVGDSMNGVKPCHCSSITQLVELHVSH